MSALTINSPNDTSISDLFTRRVSETPRTIALFHRIQGQWSGVSWEQYANEVNFLSKALLAQGLEQGDKAALIGHNTLDWFVADMAIMTVGLVSVPIYETSSCDQIMYILRHSEARILFVEDTSYIDRIQGSLHLAPNLKAIVIQKGDRGVQTSFAITMAAFIASGEFVAPKMLKTRRETIESDTIATFIYTSGTTGSPKAVILTHQNAIAAALNVHLSFNPERGGSDRISCSYLPLSHVAERVVSLLSPLLDGRKVYIIPRIDQVMDDVRQIRPTIWLGVPRIWEKIYEGVNDHLFELPHIQKALIKRALAVGFKVNNNRQQKKANGIIMVCRYWLARKIVINKLLTSLGFDRVIISITGGAPSRPEITSFFTSIGLWLQEVYGLTEGYGTTSLSTRSHFKAGSCGRPFPLLELKIASDQEILIRGDNVSPGYYKEAALTAQTFRDGWLHSGDLGYLDNEGYLWVTGRKKDIIITSGGKNITPVKIENALSESEIINYALLIGDGQKYLTALLDINREKVSKLLNKEDDKDRFEGGDEQFVTKMLNAHLAKVNVGLSRAEQIKKYRVVYDELTQESGLLTNTLKLKKHAALERYADVIAEMYTNLD